MNENDIATKILDAAFKVHRALGPGLLESAYKECLYYELKNTELQVQKEVALPLVYEDVKLECGYRADLVIEHAVLVELKSVEALTDIHLAQTLTYLKLSKCKLALLINFNSLYLKNGIKRIINGKI
ncbi:MAG: GxxExxY protein [Bacteroidota bacterium]|jgi:GxxExxY protein